MYTPHYHKCLGLVVMVLGYKKGIKEGEMRSTGSIVLCCACGAVPLWSIFELAPHFAAVWWCQWLVVWLQYPDVR